MRQLSIDKSRTNGTFLKNDVGVVASMEAGYQQTRDEHAAEIMRAVNSHDELMAALAYCLPRVHRHLADSAELAKAAATFEKARQPQ